MVSAPRRFDHDEARLRHAAGESMRSLAREYGVSDRAVRLAIDVVERARVAAYSRDWQQAGTCPDCGGPASRQSREIVRRCRPCVAKSLANVRDGEAFCPACVTWKPLAEFSPSRSRVARGVHGECRACDTARRRAYRASHREATRAYERERKQKRKVASA